MVVGINDITADVFMSAMYGAIGTGTIPAVTGFGNGVERRGRTYIREVIAEHPALERFIRSLLYDPGLAEYYWEQYKAKTEGYQELRSISITEIPKGIRLATTHVETIGYVTPMHWDELAPEWAKAEALAMFLKLGKRRKVGRIQISKGTQSLWVPLDETVKSSGSTVWLCNAKIKCVVVTPGFRMRDRLEIVEWSEPPDSAHLHTLTEGKWDWKSIDVLGDFVRTTMPEVLLTFRNGAVDHIRVRPHGGA